MRNLIIILLLSFFGHSHAQKDASDYFNAAALLYVNKNDDACKNKIKEGLQKFPTDYRLLALGKKVGCITPSVDPTLEDTDGDGIPNNIDNCDTKPGPRSNNGCPIVAEKDKDGDGIPDKYDACPDEPGVRSNFPSKNGCRKIIEIPKDKDGDGIPDNIDNCDTKPGPRSNNGCPYDVAPKDTDGDGIPDNIDRCKTEPGPRSNNGCPLAEKDTDGDGIPDNIDRCKTEPGTRSNNGCPELPPPTPTFLINLVEPHFIISGDELKDGYKVVIIFKLRNGKTKDFSTDDNKFPSNHNEGNTIFNSLGENTSGLKISFELWKDNNKIKDIKSFSNISLICKINGECGFKQF